MGTLSPASFRVSATPRSSPKLGRQTRMPLMRSRFRRKRSAHLRASVCVSTPPSLLSVGSSMTASRPSSANNLARSARASDTSLSGKKSRLPTMTPRQEVEVFMKGRKSAAQRTPAAQEKQVGVGKRNAALGRANATLGYLLRGFFRVYRYYLRDSKAMVQFDPNRPDFTPYGFTCVRWSPSPMRRPDHHNEIELNMLHSGWVTYLLGGRKVRVETGHLSLFWAAIPHQIIDYDPATEYFVATIPLSWFLQCRLPERMMQPL